MPVKSLLKSSIKNWFDKSVHSELYASNLYKHLANQMQRNGMFGAQKYFEHESKDELKHYTKLRDFVNDMGDVINIPAIEAFSKPVKSISDALDMAMKAETDLYNQYQKFYEYAEENGDCVTATFIIEFMQIQRQSVGEYGDLISRLEQAPNDVFEFDEFMEDQIK